MKSSAIPRLRISAVTALLVAAQLLSDVSSQAAALVWAGTATSTNWDIGLSTNWLNGATPSVYTNGCDVTFDDTATFFSPNLTASVQPNSVTINANNNYTFAGSGSIGGNNGLVKKKNGTLLINNVNSFSGAVMINNGILQLGTNGALGTSAANYIYATNNGTLDLNHFIPGSKKLAIAGTGYNGQGALNDSSTSTTVVYLATNLTLLADATIGSAGAWAIPRTGGTFSGNGFKLTKVGAGIFWFYPTVPKGLGMGDIDIVAGKLGFNNVDDMGNPTNTVTVEPNAMLELYGNSNRLSKIMMLTNGAELYSGLTIPQSNNICIGPITLVGTNTIYCNTAGLWLMNALVGTGGFSKIGTNVLYLNGTNTYSGPTVVSNGTLYVNDTLNISSPVSVSSGGTLGGTGSVGSVTLINGGGLEGGQSGVGALTVARLTFLANATVNLTPGTNTVPLIVTASDGLTVGNQADSVIININVPSLSPGTYHLVGYSGGLKGEGFDAFQLGYTPSGAYSLVSNPGYVDLLVSSFPAITTEPASLSAGVGDSATFSVAAADPGTLAYQWAFDGVNIVGATNATLVLTSLSTANQGIYTVVVNDGTNVVHSAGGILTVYYPIVTGQWDFKYGDLRATVGSDLQCLGDTTNLTSFPSMTINGQVTRVMAFGGNSTNEGYYMLHGASPYSGQFVNQYSLVMDVMYQSSSSGQWRALFQTDPFNHPGNDAELYVGNGSSSPNPNGIGIPGGQFNGTLLPNTWYRLAFTVDLYAPVGQQLTTYVNGTQVGRQALSGGVDGQYALGPAALLFTTGLGGGGFTMPGFVSSIQFVNGVLLPAGVAALGGPSAGKLPLGNAALQLAMASVSKSFIQLGLAGPAGILNIQSATNLVNPSWQTVGNSITNSASTNFNLTLPVNGPMGFYRVSESVPDLQVGQLPYDEEVVPTKQIIHAAGEQVQFSGRPVDLVLSPDGTTIYIKDDTSLVVVDVASWTVLQTLNYPASGASLHGIAVSPNGLHVYVTGCGNELYDWTIGVNHAVTYSRTISLSSNSDPCGVAISADNSTAYVCLNMANTLAVVNLSSGTVTRTINVGVAPWDVKLSSAGNTAYVSDWGGRFPTNGDLTATSAGSSVVVDSRGIASSGEVSLVNLVTGLEASEVPTGLHPSALALSQDGGTLYVANANSDSVTVINTQTSSIKETIPLAPYPALPFPSATLPFGTEPDGLALSQNGTNLFVACAENNGIAVVTLLGGQQTNSVVAGFFPTDWYPGAVVADSSNVYVANVKGLGTRYGQPAAKWQIYQPLGTANKIPVPSADALSKYTAQVYENGRVPQIQQTQQPAQAGVAPVPVPASVGEPSVFQHVIYIIKENKTFDEVFGDVSQGNGMSSLCVYPKNVSPNQHALAAQFVLLDNYYCNGVDSADGHCWSTEANCADHLEKSFGGFSRSYRMGTDPLTYSSSGFIWNNVLEHGLTFRNFGEFYYATVPSGASWLQIYQNYTNGLHSIGFAQTTGVAPLQPYTSTNVPGSNLNIPDVVRAYGFIKELNAAQTTGVWPALSILYLCCDHTGGDPSAQAQVADNDLAVGQVVQAVSTSRFWTNTVIFIIEDDPQSGYDHVDGHRSLCLAISPYTKRGQTISTFYNQAGVIHTMEQILGLPPMNQQDAMSPLMFDCFTNVPNFAPYTFLPNNVDLASGVGGTAALSSKARYYAKIVRKWGVIQVDHVDDNIFNRYIWHSIKGDAPYPAEFVGGHGKGLKKPGLVLVKSTKDMDD